MIKICAYCNKHNDVEQCPHCKKYFCSEHIAPIEPGSYNPEKSKIFLNQIRLGYKNTHPCPDYVDYLEQQKKIQGARWARTLDRLSGRTKAVDEDTDLNYQSNKERKYEKNEPYLYRYIPPEEQSRRPSKVNDTYAKEQVVVERSIKRNFYEKIKRKIKSWFT